MVNLVLYSEVHCAEKHVASHPYISSVGRPSTPVYKHHITAYFFSNIFSGHLYHLPLNSRHLNRIDLVHYRKLLQHRKNVVEEHRCSGTKAPGKRVAPTPPVSKNTEPSTSHTKQQFKRGLFHLLNSN